MSIYETPEEAEEWMRQFNETAAQVDKEFDEKERKEEAEAKALEEKEAKKLAAKRAAKAVKNPKKGPVTTVEAVKEGTATVADSAANHGASSSPLVKAAVARTPVLKKRAAVQGSSSSFVKEAEISAPGTVLKKRATRSAATLSLSSLAKATDISVPVETGSAAAANHVASSLSLMQVAENPETPVIGQDTISTENQTNGDDEVDNGEIPLPETSDLFFGPRRSDRIRIRAKVLKSTDTTAETAETSEKITGATAETETSKPPTQEEQVDVDMSVSRVFEDVYYVEKIVDVRQNEEGVLEYCVKWLKWPEETNTWEPETHFITGRSLEIFWRKHQKHILYPHSRIFKEKKGKNVTKSGS